jgi:hypothetical protein
MFDIRLWLRILSRASVAIFVAFVLFVLVVIANA